MKSYRQNTNISNNAHHSNKNDLKLVDGKNQTMEVIEQENIPMRRVFS